ncbi:hypothetical protein BH10BAC3_BH10BAC3_09820 [soil metagenome]
MAKQESIIPLRGTIGEITFYHTKDGFLAKKKSSLDKTRIINDPAFIRTRENASEFAKACAAGTLLRKAFKPLVKKGSDRLVVSRLTKIMLAVIQSDPIHSRGQRAIASGNLSLLKGFEFNAAAILTANFFAPIQPSDDRATGLATLYVETFSPCNMTRKVSGATHCRVSAAAAAIDFTGGTCIAAKTESDYYVSLIDNSTPPMQLTVPIPAVCAEPVFLVMGIEYFQEINGTIYPLKDTGCHAFSIVAVYPR